MTHFLKHEIAFSPSPQSMAPNESPSKTSHAGEYVYCDIAELSVGPSANVYGRVVSWKAPRPTRGQDFMMSLVLTDESVQQTSIGEADGIVANLFRANLEDFPAIEGTRDIVQMRHVRIQRYQSQLQILSTKWSAWTVFRQDPSGSWTCHPGRPISQAEIQRLNEIEAGEKVTPLEFEESKRKKTRTLQTIAQVEPDTYFDLLAEVQNDHFEASSSGAIGVLLADYSTEEPLLATFWDNFAKELSDLELKVGDLIFVSGLHAQSTDGSGRKLAAMHGTSAVTGKRIKRVPENTNLAQDLLRRKQRLAEGCIADKQIDDIITENVLKSPAKSKKRKISPLDVPTAIEWKGVPVTSVAQILAHPQKNYKFVLRARVIGCKPADPLACARPRCTTCDRSWTDKEQTTCPCGQAWDSKTFTWAFSLPVSDRSGRLDLLVCFEDGRDFLNGLAPCDLNKNAEAIERFQEILDVLQASGETNFCVASYEVHGVRRYRLVSTRITF